MMNLPSSPKWFDLQCYLSIDAHPVTRRAAIVKKEPIYINPTAQPSHVVQQASNTRADLEIMRSAKAHV